MTLQVAWFLLIHAIATAPLLCSSYSASWSNDYLPYERRIPRDIMVEVINNLGLSLLDVHNHHNDNNIAISPYGATSVLVALVEGLVGDAAYEIRQAINLPHDLAVVRVGLRDIHRHLKSYFIPKEGFLAGLTLNHDNITLNREYESILKFYGYDIQSFNNGVYPESTTTEVGSTTELSTTTESTTTTRTTRMIPDPTDEISEGTTSKKVPTRATTFSGDSEQTETKLPSTTASIAESTVEARTVKEEPTTTEESQAEITTKTTLATEEPTTTEGKIGSDATTNQYSTTGAVTETVPPTTTMLSDTTTKVGVIETTSAEEPTTTQGKIGSDASTNQYSTTSAVTETVPPTTTMLSDTTTKIIVTGTEASVTETTTPTIAVPETTSVVVSTTMQEKDISENLITDIEDTSVITTSESTTKLAEETTTFLSTTVSTDLSDLMGEESNLIEINANITFPQGGRARRSVIDYLIARYYDNYYIHSNRRYLPQVDYPKYHPQEPYTFLINGQYRESNINFMTYDTVLPFYYIPGLDAMALSFPLDSNMYYLLLILPVDEQGIDKLVRDFRKITTLERIVQNLKYTHVKALIPSFKLKGYVILTPSLQKLCIRRIFEPRHADFSQLTPEKDIYVTNIEQAVTVNIRNYVESNGVSGRNMPTNRPVEFRADHPFLYFVMDSTIHVNLMAGKIINPLNSRIR